MNDLYVLMMCQLKKSIDSIAFLEVQKSETLSTGALDLTIVTNLKENAISYYVHLSNIYNLL
jgi:hypothetical protein